MLPAPTHCRLEMELERFIEELNLMGPGTSPMVRTWGCPEKEAGITRTLSSITDSRTGRKIGRIGGLHGTDIPNLHGSDPAPGT